CDECLTVFPRAVTPLLPALDGAARRWLTRSCSPYVPEIAQIGAALSFPGGDRRNRGGARLSGRLAAQRLLPMGLHLARARGRRRALARTHAGLAIPRARPPCGCCPRKGARGRILQHHLAWLCWRADRDGTVPVRRLHQPGADVAPYPASLAARLRPCSQCPSYMGDYSPHAAGSIAAPGLRELPDICRREERVGKHAG